MSRRHNPNYPPKERKRSPLTRPLNAKTLEFATLASLLRLAEFLGIPTVYKPNDTASSFRRRITHAIIRWEAGYRKGKPV